jgi:hypothetical protein
MFLRLFPILVCGALLFGCTSNTPTPTLASEFDAAGTDASATDGAADAGRSSCGSSPIDGGTVDKSKLGPACSYSDGGALAFTECAEGVCTGFTTFGNDPDMRDYRCAPPSACELVTCPPTACCITSFSIPGLVGCYGSPP